MLHIEAIIMARTHTTRTVLGTIMDRRQFNKICSSIVIAAGSAPQALAASSQKQKFQQSALTFAGTDKLTSKVIEVGEPYLFFYPYVTTPCLLVKLKSPAHPLSTGNGSGDHTWQGGVGPDKNIVAYSAICSHKMSHPAKEISFLSYRHDTVSYHNKEQGKSVDQAGVISCCSERSVYDPAIGSKVLGGPAPHPLASIELEYDEASDTLSATGSFGADMYDKFLDKFGFRAAMEHKVMDPKTLTSDTTVVQKVSDYTRQSIKC